MLFLVLVRSDRCLVASLLPRPPLTPPPPSPPPHSLALQAKSAVQKLQKDSTELVKAAVRSIPPYMWYTALPQLTSR